LVVISIFDFPPVCDIGWGQCPSLADGSCEGRSLEKLGLVTDFFQTLPHADSLLDLVSEVLVE